MNLSHIFNTREIAYLILGAAFFVFVCLKKAMQKDFVPILVSLFNKHFIVIYILTIIYSSGCLFILFNLGMWDCSLLKDSVLWVLFAALPMMYKAGWANDLKIYFSEMLWELCRATIFLEFLVGLHTFDLWIEFLLAFLVLFLQGLILFSTKPEHRQVNKIFKNINGTISLLMFLFVIEYLYKNYSEYWTFSNFELLVLPTELSLMLFPFLYILAMYVSYEETFNILNTRIKSRNIVLYTKWKLIIHFFNNIEGLKRWRLQFFRSHPTTKDQILSSIIEVKEIQYAEFHPVVISEDEGWSPFTSKDFMKEDLLGTGQYLNHYGTIWGAVSPRLHLSNDYLANDILYEVIGTKMIVTQLELTLKVFDSSKKADSHVMFIHYISILFGKVFNGDLLPTDVANSIMKAKEYIKIYKAHQLICHLDKYENEKNSYNLNFIIRHSKHITE